MIYVLFPRQEAAALRGVALATSISRLVEVLLCGIATHKEKGAKCTFSSVLHTEGWLRIDFWRCAWPVQANYLIWGCATAAIAAILGHIGSDVVAANALAGTLRGLVIVGCGGLGTAGSILVGKLLGQGDFDNARWVGEKIFAGALVLGALSGAILLMLYRPCIAVVRLEGSAAELFRWMLLVNAVYCVGKSFNSSARTSWANISSSSLSSLKPVRMS